jgi:hypothetical protein
MNEYVPGLEPLPKDPWYKQLNFRIMWWPTLLVLAFWMFMTITGMLRYQALPNGAVWDRLTRQHCMFNPQVGQWQCFPPLRVR